MTLPKEQAKWPLEELSGITEKLHEWSSWYSGDTQALGAIYSSTARSDGSQSGLIKKAVSKVRGWFWGKSGVHHVSDRIHMGLPREIATVSSNLLFSDPVTVTVKTDEDVEDKTPEQLKAEERLALICGPELDAELVAAAESAAALGGTYLRTVWTQEAGHAFLRKVDADVAVPRFSHGRLTGVTFFNEVGHTATTVLRHFEDHWTDAEGIGWISHALYEGTMSSVGRPVPLADHPATEALAAIVDENSSVSTLTKGLAVTYVPNITPSAQWRTHLIGSNLGRSDFEGCEQHFDALDEVNSLYMREMRLSKLRIIVPEKMLNDMGAGEGLAFDADQAVFTPVKSAPGKAADETLKLEKIQFDIRTDDYQSADQHFKKAAIAVAGYSPSSFGMDDEGGMQTATEVVAKKGATYATRDRKVRTFRPALTQAIIKTLAVDAAVFDTGVSEDVEIDVQFAESSQPDPEAISRQNSADYASKSASMRTRIERANPDWDRKRVDEEMAAIREEYELERPAPPVLQPVDGSNQSDGGQVPPEAARATDEAAEAA